MALRGLRLLLFSIWLLVPSSILAQQYTLTDLGALGGRNSYASAINAHGQVVGFALVQDHEHAFIWMNGTMQDLGMLPGTFGCLATAINDRGQVVGACRSQGFLWTEDAGMTPLPVPAPNYPYGINSQGDIAGYFGTPTHAFRSSNGRFDDLGPGHAFGLNGHGQVVGINAQRALLWNESGPHDLDDEGGWTIAYGISASGVVTGSSTRGQPQPAPTHAVLWTPYGLSDLGSLGGDRASALAISGDLIVGSSTAVPGEGAIGHAFVYDVNGPGYALDLNDLVPPDSGWILAEARGINAAGQIVGSGQVNNMNRAFLLTPVPPAATTQR